MPERFVIQARVDVNGESFDNIVVDDEIPTTPTPTPSPTPTPEPINTTTLLIIGAGAVGVVIIAAVVCLRRR